MLDLKVQLQKVDTYLEQNNLMVAKLDLLSEKTAAVSNSRLAKTLNGSPEFSIPVFKHLLLKTRDLNQKIIGLHESDFDSNLQLLQLVEKLKQDLKEIHREANQLATTVDLKALEILGMESPQISTDFLMSSLLQKAEKLKSNDLITYLKGELDLETKMALIKVAGKTSMSALSKNFTEIKIEDPEVRQELALMGARNVRFFNEYIANFEIKDSNKRFEIAKEYVQAWGLNAFVGLESFQLDASSLEQLAQIVYQASTRVSTVILEKASQNVLIAFAKVVAQNDPHLLEDFPRIEDQDQLFDILKIATSKDCSIKPEFLTKLGLIDQDKLYALAAEAAEKNPALFAKNVKSFNISDVERRYTLALKCFEISPSTIDYIRNFELDVKKRFQIAKDYLTRPNVTYDFMPNFDNWEIPAGEELFELAKASITKEGGDNGQTSRFFKKFKISDENKKIEIAKLAAGNPLFSGYVDNYSIKDEKTRILLAHIAVESDPDMFILYHHLYAISDKEELFQLLEQALDNSQKMFVHIFEALSPFLESDQKRVLVISEKCFHKMVKKFPEPGKFLEVVAKFEDPINLENFVSKKLLDQLPPIVRLGRLQRKLSKVQVPPENGSTKETESFVQAMSMYQNNLIEIAETLKIPRTALQWFSKSFSEIGFPQQNIRLKWLSDLLDGVAKSPSYASLFQDPIYIKTLSIINEVANPLIKVEATKQLTSENVIAWRELKLESLPSHLLIPSLFLSNRNLDPVFCQKILNSLESRAYMDYDVINPINELLILVKKNPELNTKHKVSLLEKLFLSLEKNEKEKQKELKQRVEEFRTKQHLLVTAARDILFFEKGELLQDLTDEAQIIKAWQNLCQKVFRVNGSDEHLLRFSEIFRNSKRYPGGLFTYAARLQTLSSDDAEYMTENLGNFVNAVLNDQFPNIRYDLSKSEHLQMLFRKDPETLAKWRSHLKFPASEVLEAKNFQKETLDPLEHSKKQIIEALLNGHLGEKQRELYSFLPGSREEAYDPEHSVDRLSKLNEEFKQVEAKIKLEPKDSQNLKSLKSEKERIIIQTLIWELLRPPKSIKDLMKHVDSLLSRLPKDIVLRKDVESIKSIINPPTQNREGWIVEDTDAWEDLLLMGTEVKFSCQDIEGNPSDNRCLLAYILDGKNKPFVVKDKEGKMLARAVGRILIDEKTNKRVLFLEKLYTRIPDPELEKLILVAAKRKAALLGFPLVVSTGDYKTSKSSESYPSYLKSYSGPARYEYVDALSGPRRDGEFTIYESKVVVP